MLNTILSMVRLTLALNSAPCVVDMVEGNTAVIVCSDRTVAHVSASLVGPEGSAVGGKLDVCSANYAGDTGGTIKL